ncbi:MAG: hypothetical protein H6726_02660 [Sandaracinaceae bacterium]|nr:hypothetical protein [Sandaracinaceae bacterium]
MDHTLADVLNRSCDCVSTDMDALSRLLGESMPAGWAESLVASHPNLFAPLPVFVGGPELDAMRRTVAAMERVVALPAFVERALTDADEATRHAVGPNGGARGVFLGFDFHLGADGPRLIEVNTNAGGALLQLVLAKAQRPCCEQVERAFDLPYDVSQLEARIVSMFRQELALARPGAVLRHVAIVDDEPEGQFLQPEFELFAALFARHGIRASVTDPAGLVRVGGTVCLAGDPEPIDLVYLRATDFRLADPGHALLRAAHLDDAVVVTPPPRAHALYADKANLAVLSDAAALRELGASEEDIATLTTHVPETHVVRDLPRDTLWAERKRWFFKPRDGFGSRAAYRGDKLTRRVFDEILGAPERYVAQQVVPPSERVGRGVGPLKLDVREFAYAGEVQMVAARLYQGQTTNMRTVGGGMAAVLGARS